MKSIFARTLSPSFAISILALAVALGGGAAYATSRAAAAPASVRCVTIKSSQFQHGWHNLPHADGFGSARACKDSLGFVHLNGALTGGSANSTAFRLPTGYRPAVDRAFAVAAGTGGPVAEDVDVYGTPRAISGDVFLFGPATDAVALDGITYRAGG
jgi:hypothetical protein